MLKIASVHSLTLPAKSCGDIVYISSVLLEVRLFTSSYSQLLVPKKMKLFILFALAIGSACAQKYRDQYTTPVPILKQIDKQNDDGSYSYGYEAADGTFKIETKYPDGEVFGKYGYVDDSGKLRTVEYGASRRGFEPSGNEIQVPPPTLRVKSQYEQARPLGSNEEDDGQYREDPGAYYKNEQNSQARRYNTNSNKPQSFYINNNDPIQDDYFNALPQQNNYYKPEPYYNRPQPAYRPEPQPAYRPQPQPAYRPLPSYNNYAPRNNYNYNPAPPAYPNYNQFNGHPATNVDLASGSYSVNYRR